MGKLQCTRRNTARREAAVESPAREAVESPAREAADVTSECFILAAAPTTVYLEAEFVCDFGGLLGSTSNVEHCPPLTSHRTLLHSKLQFRLRWPSLSSPNLLLLFGKYVVWAHVAAGILECGTVTQGSWIMKDRSPI